MKIFILLKNAVKKWIAKDPFRQSAGIAYYSIFALPGLFVLILTLAGLFFGKETVNDQVFTQISSAIGEESSRQIQEIISNQKSKTREASVWGAVIGITTLLLGATAVFAQFQKTLNIIWEVEPDKSKSSVLRILKVRLFSFGLIISIAFLLMISLLITTLLSALGDWLAAQFSESLLVLIKIVNIFISLGVLTLLFALMLKVLPDAKIKWKDVWIGSFVTALLFTLGKIGLSLYFSKANPASAFGAAGSIILILLWVSYSSMIVFFGAELTRQYTLEYSGEAEPAEHAKKEDPCREDREPERRKKPLSKENKR
jgi:membrane protein